MIGTKFIIKIEDEKIFYTNNRYLNFFNTNFPKKDSFGFKTRNDVFWLVEIVNFNIEEISIEVIVLDYNSSNNSSLYSRKSKGTLERIDFIQINWYELEPQLLHYQEILFNSTTPPILSTKKTKKKFYEDESNLKYEIQFEKDTEERIKEPKNKLEIIKQIYFKNTHFKNGYISFNLFDSDILLYNSNLIEEYDTIKYYFPKVFKSKRFTVSGQVTFEENKIVDYELESLEINQIDSDLINRVKEVIILDLPNIKKKEGDKNSIFEIEDLISYFEDESRIAKPHSSLLPTTEETIHHLFIKSKYRNKNELTFLSGKIQDAKTPLKFTKKPLFGFIFTLKTDNKTYFFWELLKSHATYVWEINNQLFNNESDVFDSIDKTINVIEKIGRDKYKSLYKKSEIDKGMKFNSISHGVNKADGFNEWKEKTLIILGM